LLGAMALTDGPVTKAHADRLLFRVNGNF
jgi:hypothetical protein